MQSAGKRWGRSPLRPAPAPPQDQYFDDRNDESLKDGENTEGGESRDSDSGALIWRKWCYVPKLANTQKSSFCRKIVKSLQNSVNRAILYKRKSHKWHLNRKIS